jgi:hypothetical protein
MARTTYRWTPAEARVVIDQLNASGLSVAAFARRRGLSYERVRKWRARFDTAGAPVRPRLVELVAHPTAAPTTPPARGVDLVVRWPSGHSVELRDVELASSLRLVASLLDERAGC